jgi:septal ring factor EnvC (AmiA/AmiB activator)
VSDEPSGLVWSQPPHRDDETRPLPVVEPGRHGRRRPAPVVVVLAVALVVALVAVGRMIQVTSAQWQALARTHGDQLAQAQADLKAAQDELTATGSQLDAAQQRITQLADEKAKLGDTTAAQQQLADYQARVSQAAGKVATSLATCIDGQNKLISYLTNASAYDPASLASYRNDVQSYCGQATAANTALQRELSR